MLGPVGIASFLNAPYSHVVLAWKHELGTCMSQQHF